MRAASAREGPARDIRLRATLACARVMLRLCAVVALVLSAQQLRQRGDIGRASSRTASAWRWAAIYALAFNVASQKKHRREPQPRPGFRTHAANSSTHIARPSRKIGLS